MMLRKRILAVCLCCVLLVACSAPAQQQAPGTPRTVPERRLAGFHGAPAAQKDAVALDTSAMSQGYVGVSAVSDTRLKFQVVFGDTKYNYNLPQDGTPLLVPLQSGDGSYQLRVMQNTVEDKYLELFTQTLDVTLEDPLLPFLYSSTVVPFTSDCACAQKAAELCAGATSAPEAVSFIYTYLTETIAYDYALASSNPLDYYAAPDETLRTQKGICLDYATLAAAMLRSQGIPTKLIKGYVGEDGLYHAWNMFYTEENGWVTATITAPGKQWQRIDITFAAANDASVTGDGTLYTDHYVY